MTVVNYGHKHSHVFGHIARYLIYRHGLASVPACVGSEICRDRRANSCITLRVDSECLIFYRSYFGQYKYNVSNVREGTSSYKS